MANICFDSVPQSAWNAVDHLVQHPQERKDLGASLKVAAFGLAALTTMVALSALSVVSLFSTAMALGLGVMSHDVWVIGTNLEGERSEGLSGLVGRAGNFIDEMDRGLGRRATQQEIENRARLGLVRDMCRNTLMASSLLRLATA